MIVQDILRFDYSVTSSFQDYLVIRFNNGLKKNSTPTINVSFFC